MPWPWTTAAAQGSFQYGGSAGRQGKVIALTNPGVEPEAEDVWRIPALPAPLAGFMALPALQLFSYEMADYLGKDVDQPRNLAKSVTVE